MVQLNAEEIKELAQDVLQTCYDPEIPVNIYELGLIYEINVEPNGEVHVVMTLTAPNCPVAGSLPMEIENKLRNTVGIPNARVELTFDPPWTRDRMSEAAQLQLGLI